MKAEGGRRKAEGGEGEPAPLVERTREFSLRVMRLCKALPAGPESQNVRSQLTRAATAVAANYRGAQRARSHKEFRAKLGVVEEEADECCHWLDTVIGADLMPESRVRPLLDEANEITAIVVASLRTAKKRSGNTDAPTPAPHPSAFRLPPSAFRIGHGFDLHRLEPGYPLIVGGETLDHDRGCVAHSDGDVVYHAVTDAVLGALGQEDIGQLFPDNDPKWKAADSRLFVEAATGRMHDAGYAVGNLDATVILQRPRLSPHKAAIRRNLADLLGCDLAQVNIKGKTHEKVDALGENRAIACHVVVLLITPEVAPKVAPDV